MNSLRSTESGYLLGRHALWKFTPESTEKAIERFSEAIEVDDSFALAHAALANSYISGGVNLWPPSEAFQLARLHANRAVQLDASLAEAQVALGAIAFFYDRDWTQGERYIQHAQTLNPMSIEIHACLMHGRDVTNPQQSLPYVKDLLTRNPLSFVVKAEVGCASYYAREYTGSIEQYLAILELNPSYHHALWGLGRAYAQQGKYIKAIEVLERGHKSLGNWPALISELGYAYAMSEQNAKAEAMLLLLRSQSVDAYVDPYLMAMVHVGLGDHAQALSDLQRAVEINSTWLPWLKVEPKFDPLHSSPEFTGLLERVGLGIGNAVP